MPLKRHERSSKIIFLHVPKTAGTSLRQVVEQVYPGDRCVSVYSFDFQYRRHWRARMALRAEVEKAEVVYGHVSYGVHRLLGIDGRYVAFVRNPVDRVLSFWRQQVRVPETEYHQAISDGMSLVDLLRSGECHQVSNHMTQMLSGRTEFTPKQARSSLARAFENMDTHFVDVGIAEHMEESVARIGDRLGWTTYPAVPRLNVDLEVESFTIDQETRAEIVRFNRLDIELYNRVLQRAGLDIAVDDGSA
jgi:hypothetical protein